MLGTFGAIDVAEARKTALEMRAILDRGGDPLDERDRIKSMPTFSEFVRQEYLPVMEVFSPLYPPMHDHPHQCEMTTAFSLEQSR